MRTEYHTFDTLDGKLSRRIARTYGGIGSGVHIRGFKLDPVAELGGTFREFGLERRKEGCGGVVRNKKPYHASLPFAAFCDECAFALPFLDETFALEERKRLTDSVSCRAETAAEFRFSRHAALRIELAAGYALFQRPVYLEIFHAAKYSRAHRTRLYRGWFLVGDLGLEG